MGGTRREKETHKIGKTKYLQGGWNEWFYCGWSINLVSTFTEKNSMTSYLQGNRDWLIMSIFFINWMNIFFWRGIANRQRGSSFLLSLLSLLVSTLWGPGRGSLLLLIQVRELCVVVGVVVSFLVVWCLGWCEVSIQIGNIFIYNNSILELLRIFSLRSSVSVRWVSET